jgi:hypothetical protein
MPEAALISPSRSLLAIAAVALLAGPAGGTSTRAASLTEVPEIGDGATEDVERGAGAELDELSLRDLVADAQRLLRRRGYDPGPIDGQVGWRTQRAIREYQALARSHGYLEALNGPGVADREHAAVTSRHELVRVAEPATALE